MTGQPSESAQPVRRRKPWRRTAWSLSVGGLLGTGLMIASMLLILAGGTDIGPGRTAVWPAGDRGSVHKHPGPQDDREAGPSDPICTVTGLDGRTEPRDLDWADSVGSPTEVTIGCEQEAIFLTGLASRVVSALQSPLLFAPLGAAFFGLLLFFPRFTMAWARRG